MASHLGYSEEILAELQKQEMYSSSMEGTDKRSSIRSQAKLFTCTLLSIVSIVLIIFGLYSGYQPFIEMDHLVKANLKLLSDAEVQISVYLNTSQSNILCLLIFINYPDDYLSFLKQHQLNLSLLYLLSADAQTFLCGQK